MVFLLYKKKFLKYVLLIFNILYSVYLHSRKSLFANMRLFFEVEWETEA